MLTGIHETLLPAITVGRFPGHSATRVFTPGVIRAKDLIRPLTAACQSSWAAGQTAVWSFKPHPGDVTSGAWKPQVEALAGWLRANPGNRTIVVIWHEPENDVPKWFRQPEDFVYLFNTVHDWATNVWPELVTCHAALAYRYGTTKNGIGDAEAARWRTRATLNAVDAYSGRTWPVDRILPELPGFVRWHTCVAQGGPWAVTERGWAASPDEYGLRAETIDREAAWLASNLPEMYLVWATPGAEKDPELLLDPSGEDAVRRLLTRLNLPAGFEPSPIPGVLVHTGTGLLVAADRTTAFLTWADGRDLP